MFGQPEEEVTIETVDFDWVSKCTNIKSLRKALRVLQADGGYYPDLEKAVTKKIEELNPNLYINIARKKKFGQEIDPEQRKNLENALYEWEEYVKEKEQKKKNKDNRQGNMFDSESTQEDSGMDEDRKKSLAENEKNKGNEAIRSGEYKEALQYYTKSIRYYDKISATFCNRALVYLKLKDYKSCIEDCDKALELQPDYSKALHRRAKANMVLGNYEKAVEGFQRVMALEPNNTEVNGELMEARKKLGEAEKTKPKQEGAPANKQGGFKRVTIKEEDSESDEEENTIKAKKHENVKTETKAGGAEGTSKLTKAIDEALLEDQKKSLNGKLAKVDEMKGKANDLLKNGLYELAIAEYEKGLLMLNDIKLSGAASDAEVDLPNRKAVLLNNIGFCYMQMNLPDSVIKYTSKVIDLDGVLVDTTVKAYLRRALAYEKLDKIALSLRDYETIKHIQPGNISASEGLNRLHKLIQKDEDLRRSIEKSRSQEAAKQKSEKDNKEKEDLQRTQSAPSKTETAPQSNQTENVDSNALFGECEGFKNKGNDFFKAKNFEAAVKEFYQGQAKIEEHLNRNLPAEDKSRFEKLYVQILSNTAMSCFNINDIDGSLKNCEKALKIEPNHQKCLYRKALCQIKIGDKIDEKKGIEEIERKKKQLVVYEAARKDLEELLRLDNTNKDVKDKLSDLIRVIVQIRMKYKLVEQKQEKNSGVTEVGAGTETREETKQSKEETNKKKAPPKPTYQVPDKIIDNVVKTATEELISKEELPPTSNRFEINCQSFKKSIDKLYFYLKKIPSEHLVGLYKDKSISAELLLNIVNSLKTSGLSDDPQYCVKLLEALPNTYKFNLTVSQTVKSERKTIKSVLQELEKLTNMTNEINGLYEKYNCKDV